MIYLHVRQQLVFCIVPSVTLLLKRHFVFFRVCPNDAGDLSVIVKSFLYSTSGELIRSFESYLYPVSFVILINRREESEERKEFFGKIRTFGSSSHCNDVRQG